MRYTTPEDVELICRNLIAKLAPAQDLSGLASATHEHEHESSGDGVTDHGELTGLDGDDHPQYPRVDTIEGIIGLWQLKASGAGDLTDYDAEIGDCDASPTYGILRIGDSVIGRTSYDAGSLDLDGAVIIRNVGGPATGEIEFLFAESANAIRFAIPKSGAGNATYNARSMLLAGPAVLNDLVVTVGYWQSQGIFDNLACDTGTDGADLGVQNDCEIEGDLFVDSILESTSAAGVTIDGLLVKDSGIPEAAVTAHETALTITESQISDSSTPVVFQASKTDGGAIDVTTATAAEVTVVFDTEDVAGSGFSYATGTGILTIGAALDGKWAMANVQLNAWGCTARTQLIVDLQVDTGGGYAVVVRADQYNARDADQKHGATHIAGRLVQLATGDLYRIQASVNVDSGAPTFATNGCWWSIVTLS